MTPGDVVLICHNSRTRFAVEIVAKVTTAVLKLKRIVENTRNACGHPLGLHDHGQGPRNVSGLRSHRRADRQRQGT
jgi:hypothetical protein